MGLRKKVRKVDLPGMRASSITARASESTTASGTAIAEKSRVFLPANKKAELLRSFSKFSKSTKRCEATPSMSE